MSMFNTLARKGTRGITNTLLIGVAGLVVVGGAFLIVSTLSESFKETSFTKSVRCAVISSSSPDCPSYREKIRQAEADLADAQTNAIKARDAADKIVTDAQADAVRIRIDAKEEAREAEEQAARAKAEADAANAKLKAIEVVQNADRSFTVFAFPRDPSSGRQITVGTQYERLVPPDQNPTWECSIALSDGDAGEARLYLFRKRDGSFIDDKALRRKMGVSDAEFTYAQSVCKPTIIGG